MKRSRTVMRHTACALALVILCASLLFSCSLIDRPVPGDCNSDSALNAFDSNCIARLILGEKISVSLDNADLNSDKKQSDADRSLLRDLLAGSYLPGQRFSKIYLNGMDISNYVIIIPSEASDFEKWTAQIFHDSIKDLAKVDLEILTDSEEERPCEILIGKTKRSESQNWTASNGQYLIFARGTKIVFKGEDYHVAGGAGYIISHLEGLTVEWNTEAHIEIPKEIRSRSVEWKDSEKVFLFIGDGMGLNHTRMTADSSCIVEYSGGISASPEERGCDTFWPSTYEHIGEAVTLNIQNSTTDSAAGATALSTGYKTLNGALGMVPADLDGDGEENEFRSVQNVREAATLSGKATAVISTDKLTGATPNAFLTHHYTRYDRNILLEQQEALSSTRLACSYLWCSYDSDDVFKNFKKAIDTCDDNPGGFFIMTEEAMIDKYGEKMDYDNVIRTVKRLNTMTAYAATYATCHTDTVIVITADHETGGLTLGEDGVWRWTSDGEHTSTNVPVFAMGDGTEYFDSATRDNTDIAKFLFDAVQK